MQRSIALSENLYLYAEVPVTLDLAGQTLTCGSSRVFTGYDGEKVYSSDITFTDTKGGGKIYATANQVAVYVSSGRLRREILLMQDSLKIETLQHIDTEAVNQTEQAAEELLLPADLEKIQEEPEEKNDKEDIKRAEHEAAEAKRKEEWEAKQLSLIHI